jgi:hypothetical protein
MSDILLENGSLIVRTPYNPALVAALKATVPASDRKWDNARRAWLVAPQHGHAVVKLIDQHLGENVGLPAMPAATAARETRVLEVRYLGTTKDRGDGVPSVFAMIDGEWAAIFPEKVLREWFSAEARPDEAPTLYAVLGVPAVASDSDIKTAYRRLARTWHPDVCQEPDAKEQFMHIQHAYELLHDARTRAKYDAGLALQASLIRSQSPGLCAAVDNITTGYRPPLRYGLIMVEGHETLGRFAVEKILAWQDIVRGDGKVLVTSWPAGAKAPAEKWS